MARNSIRQVGEEEQRGGDVDEPGCLQGIEPGGQPVQGAQDERDEGSGDYAGYAEQSLADVDGHLIP